MTEDFVKTKTAGGVVVGPNNYILIVNQRGNSWSLPKGHIETGEDALSAAKREIYEETGVSDLEYLSDLGSYTRYRIGRDTSIDDTTELKDLTFFMFTTKETVLEPRDSDNPEAKWVEMSDVVNYLSHAKDREFFANSVSKIQEILKNLSC